MHPKILALCAVLLIASLLSACGGSASVEEAEPTATVPAEFAGHVLSPPLPKPQFVLTDTSGDSYDFGAETDRYVTLLYFGYTHCPDICPSHMADLAGVLGRNPDMAEHVKVVFVTVDPERDNPERLRTWLDLFDEDFIGLTGTAEEVQSAADEALARLSFPIETAAFGHGDYSVSHAALVLAYGHDGEAQVSWPFGTQQQDYENDLRILVQDGATSHDS
jgi:protein SCO1/2